jgi:type III restriction enzyme
MSEDFFRRPILNSPYDYPARHWELDSTGQPTQNVATSRRRADFITPIPKPKKRKTSQGELRLEDEKGLSTANQQYDLTSIINQVRGAVDSWRKLPEGSWAVTPETARLLKHWRYHDFGLLPGGGG